MQELVSRIIETWLNGNRKDALDTILALKKAKACLVTAYVYDLLSDYDKGVFGRMLQTRSGI